MLVCRVDGNFSKLYLRPPLTKNTIKIFPLSGGHNSMVEYQLPKLDVAGSIPVARSFLF